MTYVRTGPLGSAALGQFVIDVPPQCFDNDAFRDCYYQYLGYAQSECADPDVASMYVDREDCVRDLMQNDVWSRCVTEHCPSQVHSGGVAKYEPYPLNTFSQQTKDLQNDINLVLAQLGCELLNPDGKLGPLTCGAARKVDPGIVPPTCVKFTEPKCTPKPVVVKPAPAPVVPAMPGPTTPAPEKPKTKLANVMIGGAVVAAVGAGGYFFAKKKGMI